MAKTVLVSFGEKKKPIKVPVGTSDEISFLKSRVTALFRVDEASDITIQRYCEDWGEYIDVEGGELIYDKEKLKVVVERSPEPMAKPAEDREARVETIIHESSQNDVLCRGTSQNDSDIECDLETFQDDSINTNPDDSLLMNYDAPKDASNDICTLITDGPCSSGQSYLPQPGTNCSLQQPMSLPDTKANTVERTLTKDKGTGSGRKRPFELVDVKAVKKIKEEVVLPDPFPLPANYRADVEVALETGEMTRLTRASFITSVTDAIFAYKRYPSRDDYVIISKQIIAKYPFLASEELDNKHEGLVQSFIDRLKDKRRGVRTSKKKSITAQPENAPKTSTLKPSKAKGAKKTGSLPPVPAGEDSISFQRHCRILEGEWRKTKRSQLVIDELMARTYAFRRRDILAKETSGKHAQELFEKYPFLQDPDQLLKELRRICPDVDLEAEKWKKYEGKILHQALLESKGSETSFSHVYSHLNSQGLNDTLMALAVLPYLLPDSRNKPDHRKIVRFVEGSQPITEATASGPDTPYVLLIGEKDDMQSFLIVDKIVVCEVKNFIEIPLYLLSALYSFNICYTPGCTNFYLFLEFVFLNFTGKSPSSVKHFIAALSSKRNNK